MESSHLIKVFVSRIIQATDYQDSDEIYLINQVLGLIGEKKYQDILVNNQDNKQVTTLSVLDKLIIIAKENGTLTQRKWNEDMLGAQLMNFFVPSPSKVIQNFWHYYHVTPRQATDYLFHLSQMSNYIKTREINRNISYPVSTEYGTLEITINLTKPEKDPKKIAAALKKMVQTKQQYPSSALAYENEGYWGRLDYPARINHRVIPLVLGDEPWFFQYSPYSYFNEHAIIFSKIVRPMHVDRENLSRLLDFVTQFPDYFIGSNADLPIVGGSILSHDHFQAGRYELPMAKAEIAISIDFSGFSIQKAGILKWPMTTIRLIDHDPEKVLAAAEHVVNVWREYSDQSLSISAYDQHHGRHHTVTPIARYRSGNYEMDLVLRDNNTSEKYPDGIFHPHPDVQHIKQENIGLIEVMGLAILPPRLKRELTEVESYLLGQTRCVDPKHQQWADELRSQYILTIDNVHHIIQKSVGQIFKCVLEDAGVFKKDVAGQRGLQRFIKTLIK